MPPQTGVDGSKGSICSKLAGKPPVQTRRWGEHSQTRVSAHKPVVLPGHRKKPRGMLRTNTPNHFLQGLPKEWLSPIASIALEAFTSKQEGDPIEQFLGGECRDQRHQRRFQKIHQFGMAAVPIHPIGQVPLSNLRIGLLRGQRGPGHPPGRQIGQ